MMLFYPQAVLDSDPIRAAVAGQAGLIDETMLGRFRQDNVPVSAVADIGLRRLEALRAEWSRLPEAGLRTGSVASGLAHTLMRLDSLYQAYFSSPPAEAGTGVVNPGPADG
jgi:hypothetical protein